jgi:hypothetical protein
MEALSMMKLLRSTVFAQFGLFAEAPALAKLGTVSECVDSRCRDFERHDAIRSSSKVNGLIGRLFGEALLAIDFPHDGLA